MKSFAKRIVFIYIPHIFIEGERLRRKWDECTPYAVASGESGTSMIIDAPSSLSPDIRKGMFLKDVHFKGRMNIIRADYDYMKEVNNTVMDYLRKYSILVESVYFGGFYIDLTGTERLFGRVMDTCARILSELHDLYGFNVRIGAASNKLVSYMASKITGSGSVYEIWKDSEDIFLRPARIEYLPDIPDEIKRAILSAYNMETVEDLLAFSRSDLNALFKRHGDLLYAYSRNISHFLTPGKRERVIKRELVLSDKANDDRVIHRRFFHLVLELSAEMRREDIFPVSFDLKVIYGDDYEYSKGKGIDNPTFAGQRLYDLMLPYLDRALARRTYVKKIALSFPAFVPAVLQETLFDDDRDLKLSRVFDSIRERFGKRAIYFAE